MVATKQGVKPLLNVVHHLKISFSFVVSGVETPINQPT